MINLLNPDQKKQLRAARRNTIWLRYTLLTLASLIAINAVFGLTAWYIFGQENSYKSELSSNGDQRGSEYKKDKDAAVSFRNNLATAKTILDGTTNFSDVILAIASTVPSGCVMDNLTLSSQSFGTAQNFPFKCKSQGDALQLKSSLQKNTALFQNVNILSTTQEDTGDTPSPYPVTVTMSAILLKPTAKEQP